MDPFFRDELKKLCTAAGFTRKGQTFFRLIGDGVLQVIKCKHERRLRGAIICVGLFSMYGCLQPQWFTASGSIARYSIANCYDQNNMPFVFALPLPTQMDMLRSQVLPWLDSIDTQKKLIQAISRLDPRWNDSLKIGPYLACGEYNHAKKVIREILSQHDFGRMDSYQYTAGPDGLTYLRKGPEHDDLWTLLEMISRENPDEINTYLKDQYARNIAYAKLCTNDKT